MTKASLIVLIVILVVVCGILLFPNIFHISAGQNNAVCTMEAKICPDGTSVGRVPPKCEFAPCSTSSTPINALLQTIPSDWKTYTDIKAGLSFKYPTKFPYTYIIASRWPPKITATSTSYSCKTGLSADKKGQIVEKAILGNPYCISFATKNASSTVSTNYSYSTSVAGRTVTGNIILNFLQCGNLASPQKTACEAERKTLNLDLFMNKIIQSTTFK